MLLTLFKEVIVKDLDTNMDLLAIIVNNIYDKDSIHKDILYKYLEYLNLKEENIQYIKSQKFNIRTYCEEYFINKLSINYKKYLYLILNYFLKKKQPHLLLFFVIYYLYTIIGASETL